jgi:hypothetical protein
LLNEVETGIHYSGVVQQQNLQAYKHTHHQLQEQKHSGQIGIAAGIVS